MTNPTFIIEELSRHLTTTPQVTTNAKTAKKITFASSPTPRSVSTNAPLLA